MDTATPQRAPAATLHPLLLRLVRETDASVLDTENLDAWVSQPGVSLLVFADDPQQHKETLDLAVIVPELHAACAREFRVGLLCAEAARASAPRYGFVRWPAFVMLRDGRYVGAVDGIRDWDVYVHELKRLRTAEPTRAPGVGVPVTVAHPAASAPCA